VVLAVVVLVHLEEHARPHPFKVLMVGPVPITAQEQVVVAQVLSVEQHQTHPLQVLAVLVFRPQLLVLLLLVAVEVAVVGTIPLEQVAQGEQEEERQQRHKVVQPLLLVPLTLAVAVRVLLAQLVFVE
jgi:hypothetical protein